MQQSGTDEQLFPGLLDLSSLPNVLERREIDLGKMAENRAEAKQQQIQSGKRQSSKQSVQVPLYPTYDFLRNFSQLKKTTIKLNS